MLEWRSLISEDMKTLSLGRVAFWLCFFISCYYWFIMPLASYPQTLLYLWEAVLAYNFASKMVKAYQNVRLPNEMVGNVNSSGFRVDTYTRQGYQPYQKPNYGFDTSINNGMQSGSAQITQIKQNDIDKQDISQDDIDLIKR